MSTLRNITISSFHTYRTGQKNWKDIPIEFLGIFRKFIAPSEYKLSFKGTTPKGQPSYLKLYAETFSVSYRHSEVLKMVARQDRMALRRETKKVEELKKSIAKLKRRMAKIKSI